MDTGVLVAGIYWRNEPHRCVAAWLRGVLTLVISDAIFLEYERVLREVKNEQGFTTDLEPWLAALAAGAQTIIARDRDLTVLKRPFGIRILTPRAWLATLSRVDRRRLS